MQSVNDRSEAVAFLSHRGEIVFVTDGVLAISGYDRRELVGKPIFDFFLYRTKELRAQYESIVAQPNLMVYVVLRMTTKRGQVIRVGLTIRNLLHLPDYRGVVVILRAL